MNKAAPEVTVTVVNIRVFRKTKTEMLNPGRATDPGVVQLVKAEPF